MKNYKPAQNRPSVRRFFPLMVFFMKFVLIGTELKLAENINFLRKKKFNFRVSDFFTFTRLVC